MRLDRGAPIGSDAAQQARRAKWIGPHRVLLAEAQRLVAGDFEIEQIVDEGVGAHAANMGRKRALDQRRRLLWSENCGCRVGKGPGWRGVPDILHSRVVVGGDAVDQVEGNRRIPPLSGYYDMSGRARRRIAIVSPR